LTTVGSQTVTVNDTVATGSTGNATVDVKPAAASQLVLSPFPSPSTAGVAANVTLTAKDAFNNVATGYRGTVTFSSSDGQAALPADYTFTVGDNGVHIFSVTLKTAGQQSLTVKDSANGTITTTQPNLTVNPAAAASLKVGGPPNGVFAGSAFSVLITALDAFNNVATGYTGAVQFTSGDSTATRPADYQFVGSDNGQ